MVKGLTLMLMDWPKLNFWPFCIQYGYSLCLFPVTVSFCILDNFFMFLLSSADFFFKIDFSNNSFRNTIWASNSLDLDLHSVRPDLGPNCLPRLSANDNIRDKEWIKLHCGLIKANTVDRILNSTQTYEASHSLVSHALSRVPSWE